MTTCAEAADCRFGCRDRAVAAFEFDAGCICFPEDREQALCLHHAMRSTPLGSMTLLWCRHFVRYGRTSCLVCGAAA